MTTWVSHSDQSVQAHMLSVISLTRQGSQPVAKDEYMVIDFADGERDTLCTSGDVHLSSMQLAQHAREIAFNILSLAGQFLSGAEVKMCIWCMLKSTEAG